MYLSLRAATADDDSFEVFRMNDQEMIVDRILGIHVDDIIAARGNIYHQDDILKHEPKAEPTCYAERMHVLLHRFRFGGVDFGDQWLPSSTITGRRSRDL